MINQTDSNTIIIGTELEWGFNMRGAYNWTYFSFTVDGPITGGAHGRQCSHKRTKLPSSMFHYFFLQMYFSNLHRLENGCSSAATVKEGLWILLKTLAEAFPFNRLISHEAPIVIKLVRDIKGKILPFNLRVNCGILASYFAYRDWDRHLLLCFFICLFFFCTGTHGYTKCSGGNKYRPRWTN